MATKTSTAKKAAPKKVWLAVRGYHYPKDKKVRDAIRAGNHMPMEDRGVIVSVSAGSKHAPPADLIDGLKSRGIIEQTEEDDHDA